MASTVGDMSPADLREMLEDLLEEKLSELIHDPDQGLEVRASLRRRLQAQKTRTAAGERGRALEGVARDLGIGDLNLPGRSGSCLLQEP